MRASYNKLQQWCETNTRIALIDSASIEVVWCCWVLYIPTLSITQNKTHIVSFDIEKKPNKRNRIGKSATTEWNSPFQNIWKGKSVMNLSGLHIYSVACVCERAMCIHFPCQFFEFDFIFFAHAKCASFIYWKLTLCIFLNYLNAVNWMNIFLFFSLLFCIVSAWPFTYSLSRGGHSWCNIAENKTNYQDSLRGCCIAVEIW